MGNVTAGLKKWTWWDEPYLLIFMPLLASLLSALNLGSPRTCIINQWNAAEVTMQDFWVQPLRSPGSVHFHTWWTLNHHVRSPTTHMKPRGQVSWKGEDLRIHGEGENPQCPSWTSIWLQPHARPQQKSVVLSGWTQLKSPTHKIIS